MLGTIKRLRLIGLPGTGKTTRLLEYLEELLEEYQPTEIIYCSFSNAAVNEAKERVQQKFNIASEDLKYFKTMHSLCLRLLKEHNFKDIGSKPATDHDFQQFLNTFVDSYPELADYLEDLRIFAGTTFYVSPETKDDPLSFYTLGTNPAVFFRHIFNYMYATYGATPLTSPQFHQHLGELQKRIDLPKRYFKDLYALLLNLEREWRDHKKQHEIFEFDELLYLVYTSKLQPRVSVLIVDEYQDSSKLQAKLVDIWSEKMKLTIVAGDPNQSIYGFNGADPQYLDGFEADKTVLLHKTWRMPQVVVDYATSILHNHWTEQMIAAIDKPGLVTEVEWSEIIWEKYDSVYILGRTVSTLKKAQEELINLGIVGLVATKELPGVNLLYTLYYHYANDISVDINLLFNLRVIYPKLYAPQIRTMLIEMEERESKQKSNNNNNKNNYTPKLLTNEMLSIIFGVSRAAELQQHILRIAPRKDQIIFRKLISANIIPQKTTGKFPSIEFMTIHASKGMEADCIILLTSSSWYETECRVDDEEEKRVYFVAATRTRQDLLLVNIDDSRERTQFLPSVSTIVEQT